MFIVIILCFLTSPALSNLGNIHVEGYGEVWVHSVWDTLSDAFVHDNGFTIRGMDFLYFGTGPESNMIWKTPLMDRNFSYTVDLSSLTCDCVVTASFLATTEDEPVCGANGNILCPEYTILEASSFAATSSLHNCYGEPDHWDTCDWEGCMENSLNVDPNMLCPEERCTINTKKPFIMSHFQNPNQATTWMYQDGKTASYEKCSDSGYLSMMAPFYDGMLFTASLWAEDPGMCWCSGWPYDDLVCREDLCKTISSRTVTFTDFKLSARLT